MNINIRIVALTATSLLVAHWSLAGSGPTISGAYDNSDKRLGVEAHWDFRSDGTFVYVHWLTMPPDAKHIKDYGTYTITGNKLTATTTSEPHDRILTQEFTIEPNGDLLDGDRRMKKE